MSKPSPEFILRSAFAATLIALATLTGCQTYTAQSSDLSSAWQSGNAEIAVLEVNAKAEEKAGSKDELLWRLEQGTVLSSAGDIEAGIEAFDTAEELVNAYEDKAKTSLTGETIALLSNQAQLPYRGKAYDKIMMNTYKALNYLLLSDAENTRVELNRTLQRQRDAVAANQKRIEEDQQAVQDAKDGKIENEKGESTSYDVDRARQDPQFASATDAELAKIDERLLPYADYVNPFTVFVDGLFFSHMGLDNSDVERSRKSFERVASMSPGTYIQQDYAMAEAMADGAPADTITYVVFATGSAPVLDQLKIDIPLFLVSSVSYVGAAFPRLEYRDRFIPQLTASTTDGAAYTSQRLASMDAVISQDFKNAWPSVVTKTLISTATKAIAGKQLEDSADSDWRTLLAARAANILYQASVNNADVRSWTTLPKEFAYSRLPTPADGQLQLDFGMFSKPVTVVPGKTNVVMVRSINDTAQPIINTFTLN
jgi:hypothetical protein